MFRRLEYMSKKLVLSDNSDRLRAEIGYYSVQLRDCIDRTSLLRAYQVRRRNERLYAYHAVLRDACCKCFRGTEISVKGKSGVCKVWGFDGRVWVVISPSVFMDVVGEAIIGASGAGDFVVTGDWMDKKGEMLSSAYAGVCSSPLLCNPSVVGFSNGVWDFGDIDSPVYHPFEDRMPVTDLLPYDYDPSAVCPLWTSFLGMMLSQKDVMRLQKYLGLGIVNRRMMGHVVEDTLWLIGSGANGKTTIENVVRAVYGYDNISEASMGELLDRNQISRMLTMASIEGKIFNICSEVDMGDISKGSDAFKKLCSGEPQSARNIGRDIHIAYDIPFLIFSMNQKPSNRRMDEAFRRRIVEIVFKATVRRDEMDPQLGSKLRAELPGIRNWMIDGFRRLRSDGFLFDHTSDDDYQEANGQYFDIFARAEGLRASAWAGHNESAQLVGAQVLLERYDEFCMRKMLGCDHPTMRQMVSDMKRLNFHKVRKAAGVFYEVYCDNELDYSVKV